MEGAVWSECFSLLVPLSLWRCLLAAPSCKHPVYRVRFVGRVPIWRRRVGIRDCPLCLVPLLLLASHALPPTKMQSWCFWSRKWNCAATEHARGSGLCQGRGREAKGGESGKGSIDATSNASHPNQFPNASR